MKAADWRIRMSSVVLITAFVVLLFNSGTRFSIGLLLKPMVEDLGWTRSTLSAAVALFMVLSALALPFAGRLVDRFGAVVVLGASVVIGAVGLAGMSVIRAPWEAFVLYGVVFALGSAGTSIAPVGVLISRWFPSRLGLANSVAISGMGAGQLVIISVLSAQLTDLGWRGSFLWLGIASAVVVVPLLLVAGRAAPPDAASTASSEAKPGSAPVSVRETLKTGPIWRLFGLYAVCGFHDFFMATHIVAFALDQGVEPQLAGHMLAFMGLFGLAGVILAGLAADRVGPAGPTIACFILRIVLFAFATVATETWLIVTIALLFGSTFWVTAPLTVVFVRNSYGVALLGTLAGMVTMVHHAAGGLGAYLGAAVFDRTGSYDWGFVAMVVMTVPAILWTLPFWRRLDDT